MWGRKAAYTIACNVWVCLDGDVADVADELPAAYHDSQRNGDDLSRRMVW